MRRLAGGLLLGLLLAGCRTPAPDPVPTPAPTVVPTVTVAPAPTASPAGPGVPADVAAAIRALVDDGYTPGLVVAVVDASGISFAAYGRAAYDDPRPVDEHTLFEIGSVTKTFVGLLLAQAVEEGRVALDDPAADFLPPGVVAPSLAGRAITFGQLATHTSGLPRWPPALMPSPDEPPVSEDVTCDQMAEALAAHELDRLPGLSYEYSNWGLGLLGLALEGVYGEPLDPLLRDRVMAPLGLDDTVYVPTPDQAARQATGYQDGETAADPIGIGCISLASGALQSTAADLARYVAAQLGLLETDLAPAIRRTQQPQFERGPDNGIGLVWELSMPGELEVIEHGGATLGFNSYVGFSPDRGRGVVVLANAWLPAEVVGRHLLDPALAALPVLLEEGVADPARFADYAGRYGDMTGPGFEAFVADGQLYGRFPFWFPMRLHPLAGEADTYFSRTLPFTARFLRDETGAVNAVRLGDESGFQFYARAE